VITGL